MKRKAIAYPGYRTIKKRKTNPKVSKAVVKYVKKSLNKAIETKYFRWNPGQQSLIHSSAGLGLYVCNLTYGLTRGTAGNQFIGNKIKITGFSFKYSLENFTNKDAYFNYALVSSDAEISDNFSQDWNLQSATDVVEFIENSSTQASNWRTQPLNINVLKRGSKRMRRPFADSNTFERGSLYKSMNMNFTYDASYYGKGKNLYMICWLYVCNAGINDTVLLYSDCKLYFKDA